MNEVKSGTWLHDIIEVYNDLGGEAAYKDVYALAKKKRLDRNASWTSGAKAIIRRVVEENARSSALFKGRSIFYSVNGHGQGVWSLMPDYRRFVTNEGQSQHQAYLKGIEGILQEYSYLTKSRDPRLVEERKAQDDFKCQACGFKLKGDDGKYIIDVHHLNPIGSLTGIVITSINDLGSGLNYFKSSKPV